MDSAPRLRFSPCGVSPSWHSVPSALASGVGAQTLLEGALPNWSVRIVGSMLVLFSAFSFAAAVWREARPGLPPPAAAKPPVHGAPWLAGRFASGTTRPLTVHLDVGLHEGAAVGHTRALYDSLRAAGHRVTHDAWGLGTLVVLEVEHVRCSVSCARYSLIFRAGTCWCTFARSSV